MNKKPNQQNSTAAAAVNIRSVALDVLMFVTEDKMFMNKALEMALQKYAYIPKQDRALLSRLIHGTLEYLQQIDYVIDLFSNVALARMRPIIRGILRLGVYQLMYMDRIPAGAVCNESVKLAEKRRLSGLKGFVNAVLRKIDIHKDEIAFTSLGLSYSVPEWLAQLLCSAYQEDTVREILSSFLDTRPLNLRINTSISSVEEVQKELAELGIKNSISPLHPEVLEVQGLDHVAALACIKEGRAVIQDSASALVAEAVPVKEGDFILDTCASPGGKSMHFADKLKGSGKVLALDVSEAKLLRIQENSKRCGMQNIETGVWDAAQYNPDWEASANIVVADVPCSGLGVLGRKPDIKLHLSYSQCLELSSLQEDILENVSRYVKKGGFLIYSTCTINPSENWGNIAGFLERHEEYQEIELWQKERFRHLSAVIATKHGIQLLPSKANDGFFICAMQRRML